MRSMTLLLFAARLLRDLIPATVMTEVAMTMKPMMRVAHRNPSCGSTWENTMG